MYLNYYSRTFLMKCHSKDDVYDILKMFNLMQSYLNKIKLNIENKYIEKNILFQNDYKLFFKINYLTLNDNDIYDKENIINNYISKLIKEISEMIDIFYEDFPNDNYIARIMGVFEMKKKLCNFYFVKLYFIVQLENCAFRKPLFALDLSFFEKCIQNLNFDTYNIDRFKFFFYQIKCISEQKFTIIDFVYEKPLDHFFSLCNFFLFC